MAGITGFNPGMAKKNIEDFNEQSYWRYLDIGEEYYSLFANLSNSWASPKAQEFDATYRPMIQELLSNYKSQFSAIVSGAISAYNAVAAAHGAGGIGGIDQSYVATFGEFPALLADKDGVVGMEVEVVRDSILPTLKSNIGKVVDMINSLPSSIALYDDEDGQRHAYATHISNVAAKLSSINNQIVNSIQSAIDDNSSETLAAKEQATSTLAG